MSSSVPIPGEPQTLQAQLPGESTTGPGRLLQEGQLLCASVLQVLEGNQVRLGLLGFELLATSKLALQPGQELTLLVGRDGDTVLLRPVEPALLLQAAPGEGAAASLAALPAALTRLRLALPAASARTPQAAPLLPAALPLGGPESTPSAEQLKAFHDWFGRGFERRLLALAEPNADVAALRRELLQSLRSQDVAPERPRGEPAGEGHEALRRQLAELARTSDAWRGEQAQRAESGAPLVFPLPIREGSFLRDGRLYLVREEAHGAQDDAEGRGGAAGSAPFTLVFLLELESLGSLRIDASMVGRDVVLGFVCALEQAALRIHAGLQELEEHFAAQDLRLVRSTVRVQRDGVIPVLDLLPPAPRGSSRLDVRL